MGNDRARSALRPPGQADGRPQFHERLIPIARGDVWGRYEILGELPYAGLTAGALDVVLDCEEAGHDPGHVAVHHRGPASECDAGDCTRRIPTNAVEATERVHVTRKVATVLFG